MPPKVKHINDPAEVDRLVNENMALAQFFANKWQHLDPDEALSQAMEGLLVAAQEWDGRIPFGSYASMRIKWTSQRHALPGRRAKRGGGIPNLSLDAPLTEDGFTLGDALADSTAQEAGNIVGDAEMLDKVSPLLSMLDERSREVVVRRFGIGVDAETLEEIAATMGLTRERIRQVQNKAMCKLANAAERLVAGRLKLPSLEPSAYKDTCPHCRSHDTKKFGFFKNIRGNVQRFGCNGCGRRFSRDTTVNIGRWSFTKVYPRKGKAEAVVLAIESGLSIRATNRKTGVHDLTITAILKQMKQQGFVHPTCGCGKPVGHKGWCRQMFAAYPVRRAYWNGFLQRRKLERIGQSAELERTAKG